MLERRHLFLRQPYLFHVQVRVKLFEAFHGGCVATKSLVVTIECPCLSGVCQIVYYYMQAIFAAMVLLVDHQLHLVRPVTVER